MILKDIFPLINDSDTYTIDINGEPVVKKGSDLKLFLIVYHKAIKKEDLEAIISPLKDTSINTDEIEEKTIDATTNIVKSKKKKNGSV